MFHVFFMLVCVIFKNTIYLLFIFCFIPCDWVIIRFSNILYRKTNVIRRRSGSSPDFFKISLVQNRAILDTSGGLSRLNKRIDCPFCDELSFE